MTAADEFRKRGKQYAHQSDAVIHPMRGQCVVREIDPPRGLVTLIELDPEGRRVHRGIVLAHGAPAFLSYDSLTSPEVPWDLKVGDEVVYVWIHNEREFTKRWHDGGPASWIPQAAIMAVIEP